MNLRIASVLTISTLAFLGACTPAAEEPAPAAPPPAPIAEAPAGPSGPAAENTTDSLSSAPAGAAAPAPLAAPAAGSEATPEELASGRAIYAGAGSCAMCHGPTGQGTQMGIALTAGLDYEAVKEKIVKGMVAPGEKMPPMGAALSAEQLDDLSKFVAAGLPQ